MIRTVNAAEHSLLADPPKIVALAAATPVEVFPNESGIATGEIAYRYIQNVGANPVFYSFGLSNNAGGPKCDGALNYHGVLPQYSQLDCSNHRLRVCCYSTAGSTVATTLIRRADLTKHN